MKRNQKGTKRQGDAGRMTAGISRTEIFKYLAGFLLLMYVVLLLIYSSGSTKVFDEVAGSVEAGLNTERLIKQNTQALKRFYGVNSADYEGVMFYTAKDSISAEEILLVKAKNDRQVQILKDAVQKRLDNRKDIFENMAPGQVRMLDKARVLVRGRFVFVVVSKDAKEYAELFAGSL